jgi:hypothetical protein
MYGPITTVRREKQPVKHIPWAAFKMVEADWKRVIDARDILAVSRVVFILLLAGLTNRSNVIGFKPYPATLLLRKGANTLACPTGSRGTSNSMGKEARHSEIRIV